MFASCNSTWILFHIECSQSESECQNSVCRKIWMFSSFTGSDFHAGESFPADMSFGELSLIKSQSHLRSHIRIDQFSCGWNCSWPLLPWALIQNQQRGHRGLKQLNGVRLQEAGESTGGKYPIKQRQPAISRGPLSSLMSWWVTYSFVYAVNVNDKGVIPLRVGEKWAKIVVPCQKSDIVQCKGACGQKKTWKASDKRRKKFNFTRLASKPQTKATKNDKTVPQKMILVQEIQSPSRLEIHSVFCPNRNVWYPSTNLKMLAKKFNQIFSVSLWHKDKMSCWFHLKPETHRTYRGKIFSRLAAFSISDFLQLVLFALQVLFLS